MSVNLSNEDFNALVAVLLKMDDFTTANERRGLLATALQGNDRASVILGGIDFSGGARTVAVNMLMSLQNFGQVIYGKEALGIFLNYVSQLVGKEEEKFVRTLFTKYLLDVPVAEQPVVSTNDWRGKDTPESVQEKVIGENTLRDYRILQLAVEAGRAVVHLRVQTNQGAAAGTGFMITPDTLITNNHVLGSADEATGTVYSFNYQLAPDGNPCVPDTVTHDPNGFFLTNPALDYSIVQLKTDQLPDFGKPVTLKPQIMKKDNRVAIIQHPGGNLKQFSDQNNFVQYADKQVVQYTTTTLPGSSGSPVFNDLYEVVALHHAGGDLLEPGTKNRYLRNEGISIIAVLDDIEKQAPQVYAQIKQA